MSTAFESIKQGLQEAIAHARGEVHGDRTPQGPAVVPLSVIEHTLKAEESQPLNAEAHSCPGTHG